MNGLKHIPMWLLSAGLLLAAAAVLRFAMRGYSYIAHTLTLIAVMIILHRFLGRTLWHVAVALVCIGFAYFIAVEIPIIKNARTDADAGRKYLIVLGAEVRGNEPSLSLLRRLQGAKEYLETYPDSVAIVSGGQGDGENLTEAQCMYDWLTAQGIAAERVIREDNATSTMENLSFSFDIIRERGDEPDGNTAILSSSYHLYRAKLMAKRLGVEAAGVAGPPGYPIVMLNFFIREAFGVTHLWVLGN